MQENPYIPDDDDRFIQKITNKFNDSIVFEPSHMRMSYTIRDPIINSKTSSLKRGNGKFSKHFISKSVFFTDNQYLDSSKLCKNYNL